MCTPLKASSVDKLKALGIIPARGGSKRAPGKNVRLLNKKPLICYTIEASQKSGELDRLIISTDHAPTAEICKRAGAEVPFLRPAELAQDDTPDRPVLLHAIKSLRDNEDYVCDAVVLLRPTTPFKTPSVIDEAIRMLYETGADSVRTVARVDGVQHPYWMFKMDHDRRARSFVTDVTLERYFQRQLLPPVYRLNSVVDVIKTEIVLNHDKLYGDDMRLFEVPEHISLDIDTELDFKLCEIVAKEMSVSE